MSEKETDYKKAYEDLKKFVIGLAPYCDTCLNNDNEDECDGCNRKAFNWECDPEALPEI